MSIYGKPFLTGVKTGTASGPIVSISDALAAPLRSLLVNIEPVQEGTGDPSPDNVRPISGWSEVNVWRTGKNLLNNGIIQNPAGEYGVFLNADGSMTIKASASSSSMAAGKVGGGTAKLSDFIPGVKVGSTCILSLTTTSYRKQIYLSVSGSVWTNNTARAITQDDLDSIVYFYANDVGSVATITNLQIELGSTATAYEPYSGNQYIIQLGQTVYGATLDVTNGVLTVDREIITFTGATAENWKRSSTYNGSFYINTVGAHRWPSLLSICTHAKPCQSFPANYQYGEFGLDGTNREITNIWVQNPNTTVEQFKEWLAAQNTNGTPLRFVYELAASITITLTPQEISTLQGQNNLWADSGAVDMEYLKRSLTYIS